MDDDIVLGGFVEPLKNKCKECKEQVIPKAEDNRDRCGVAQVRLCRGHLEKAPAFDHSERAGELRDPPVFDIRLPSLMSNQQNPTSISAKGYHLIISM